MDRHIKQNLTGQSHSEWDMPSKPFLTIGEVANLLQVSNRTVYNLIHKGTLRACKITYHMFVYLKSFKELSFMFCHRFRKRMQR